MTTSPTAAAGSKAHPATFDPQSIDFDGFLAEIRVLRKEIDDTLGERDFAHLLRLEKIGRAATLLGVATSWIAPNPISMAALSFGRSARWIFMHHIGHRGYDRVPGVPHRYTSKGFARGARRFLDWTDWMIPEAWIYEHNVLHHSHVGEERDPDLVERNMQALRDSNWPMPARYVSMAFLATAWRSFYYAPNTLRVWRDRFSVKDKVAGANGEEEPGEELNLHDDGTKDARRSTGHERELWLRCFLPYTAINFVALPALFAPLGPWAVGSALANSVGAEVLTNIHTFAVIGPNHSGEDIYRFTTRSQSKAEWTLRQILGSVNYACGDELTDALHLYLNYQIEHHIWPDLPMLRYREVQPKVKALCEKYGIPYLQESVFTRLRKMVEISVGKTSMRVSSGFFSKRAAHTAVLADAAE